MCKGPVVHYRGKIRAAGPKEWERGSGGWQGPPPGAGGIWDLSRNSGKQVKGLTQRFKVTCEFGRTPLGAGVGRVTCKSEGGCGGSDGMDQPSWRWREVVDRRVLRDEVEHTSLRPRREQSHTVAVPLAYRTTVQVPHCSPPPIPVTPPGLRSSLGLLSLHSPLCLTSADVQQGPRHNIPCPLVICSHFTANTVPAN